MWLSNEIRGMYGGVHNMLLAQNKNKIIKPRKETSNLKQK